MHSRRQALPHQVRQGRRARQTAAEGGRRRPPHALHHGAVGVLIHEAVQRSEAAHGQQFHVAGLRRACAGGWEGAEAGWRCGR